MDKIVKEFAPMWDMTSTTQLKAKEYKTIMDFNPEVLDAQVNSYLQKGWELYGYPHVILTPTSKTHLLVQTVVLYEEVKEIFPLHS